MVLFNKKGGTQYQRTCSLFLVSVMAMIMSPVFAKGQNEPELEEWQTLSSEDRYMYGGIALVLICFAGLFSGMTVGLLSLDPIELKIKLQSCTTEEERLRIHRVLGLVQRHHLLLVTLLLGNSICMEALPLCLDKMMPSWLAVLMSVTAVLFFGEILPQAFCTGKHQLKIASAAAPVVWGTIFFFFPLGWPLGKILDLWLGHETEDFYERDHLKALIRMHGSGERALDSDGGDKEDMLNRDEVVVIEGALDLARKKVSQVMVAFENVYALDMDQTLNKDLLREIVFSGHSRIPVYEGHRQNIRGLLLVKQLVLLDPNENAPVRNYVLANPLVAHPAASLYDMLNEFQVGKSHFALVTEHVEELTDALEDRRSVRPGTAVLGIITLEDVIEELIQEEILDEFDGGDQGNNPILQSRSFPAINNSNSNNNNSNNNNANNLLSNAGGLRRVQSFAPQVPSFIHQVDEENNSNSHIHYQPAAVIGVPPKWAPAAPEVLEHGGKTIAAQALLSKLGDSLQAPHINTVSVNNNSNNNNNSATERNSKLHFSNIAATPTDFASNQCCATPQLASTNEANTPLFSNTMSSSVNNQSCIPSAASKLASRKAITTGALRRSPTDVNLNSSHTDNQYYSGSNHHNLSNCSNNPHQPRNPLIRPHSQLNLLNGGSGSCGNRGLIGSPKFAAAPSPTAPLGLFSSMQQSMHSKSAQQQNDHAVEAITLGDYQELIDEIDNSTDVLHGRKK